MDMHFEGTIFQTHAEELARRIRHPFPPYRVFDLRSREAWEAGHLPGATPATVEGLSLGLPEGVDRATELILVGEDADDPSLRPAALALMRHGARRVVEFPGGMLEWRQRGLPRDPGARAA